MKFSRHFVSPFIYSIQNIQLRSLRFSFFQQIFFHLSNKVLNIFAVTAGFAVIDLFTINIINVQIENNIKTYFVVIIIFSSFFYS